LNALSFDDTYFSILTVGELRKGILRLPEGRRRDELRAWLQELTETFSQHILPLSFGEISAWAELIAAMESVGAPLSAIDGLIAATAIAHQFAIATRNTADVDRTGAVIYNPWTGEWLNR